MFVAILNVTLFPRPIDMLLLVTYHLVAGNIMCVTKSLIARLSMDGPNGRIEATLNEAIRKCT